MNWIRIAVGIMDDPSILRVSEATGVSVPATTGHVVGVLVKLPTHAKAGDLSGVTDRAIEQWAQWKGKAGKFAEAFRAYLCDAQGVVGAWEKHNGSAIREADRRAASMRERRSARERDRHVTGNDGGTVTVTPALTGRDGTGRNELQQLLTTLPKTADAVPARKKPAKEPAKFPNFPTGICAEAHEAWQSSAGATEYPRFRKAFAPLFGTPEAERPASYPRNAELLPAVKLYLQATLGTREAQFRSPERCAAALSGLVEVLRTAPDPLARLERASRVLGIQPQRVA